MNTPKISVIIPVYNAEKYLRQCLESVVSQSLHDIEIICVDDGSDDRSFDILQEYQQKDPRFILLQQQNQYAGTARNNGMAQAKGEYLAFLDADDFFEPEMLEQAFLKCIEDHADLCLWGGDYYDSPSDTYSPFEMCLNIHQLPARIPFSVQDVPDHIFEISSGVPWNKLYKRSMVQNNHILYPNTKRGEDAYFAGLAMCCAKKITVINRIFVHYRQAHGSNLQAKVEETPLDWYHTLQQLKESLQQRNILDAVRLAYLKFLIGNGSHHLNLMHSFESFNTTFETLRHALKEELQQQEIDYNALPAWFADQCRQIVPYTLPQHLFVKLQEHNILQERTAQLFEQERYDYRQQIEQISQSKTQQKIHLEQIICEQEKQLAQHMQAIDILKQEKENLRMELRPIKEKAFIRRAKRYHILTWLTWGAKRRKYKTKLKRVHQQLEELGS